MSTFDDPNRESVGLAPIWTGAGEEPPPEGDTSSSRKPDGALFDPADHTVAEVNDYLTEHPEDADRVLDAEASGKARVSIVGGDD